MKKCETYAQKKAKLGFLKCGWWWKKIAFGFYPITIPVALFIILIICIIDSMIAACKEFSANFAYFWQDIFHGKKPFGMFEAMYAGWFIWSHRKAADYLFGVTDKELADDAEFGLPPTKGEDND